MNQSLRSGRSLRNRSLVLIGKAVLTTAFLFNLNLAAGAPAASPAPESMAAGWLGAQDPGKPKPSPEPAPAETPGQKPSGPPAPAGKDRQVDLDAESIRIDSTLVVVPVSVTDLQGQPIRALTAEDFILEEEGVTQQVQTLGDPGKTPLELAVLSMFRAVSGIVSSLSERRRHGFLRWFSSRETLPHSI